VTPTAALVVAAALSIAPSILAKAGGIVTTSCDSCHGMGQVGSPQLTLGAEPAVFNPGDSVTLTLVIRSAAMRVGGAFITTGGAGTLQVIAGEGLAINAQGLTHTSPKVAVDGAVTFRFAWRVPSTPGAVDFGVAALAGNGNAASSGDSPGSGEFQWVYGCAARTSYRDLDRDGYGSKSLGARLGCAEAAAPSGYALLEGDCDENSEKVHPGATELCNLKDDDCDGQIDEDAPALMMWPDADGDGFYAARAGNAKLGCGDVPGYAASGGDCDDEDPAVNPGASESCNNRDDDCDGEIDELVRPRCGVGWCARYSLSCDAADCRPGLPAAEKCNHFDDDCDGEDDNAACPRGMSCQENQCVSGAGGVASGPAPGSFPAMAGAAAVASSSNSGRAAQRASGCSVSSAPGTTAEGGATIALAVCFGCWRFRRRGRSLLPIRKEA
jgi:putative metal-binding protein